MSEGHFDYIGKIHVGDRVEVSLFRDFRDRMSGEIISVSDMCCDVAFTDRVQGKGLLKFCWHIDDPRMKIPGRFEEAQKRNQDDVSYVITMGVFRLTHSQVLINELPHKLLTIESMLENIVDRMAKLEGRMSDSGPQDEPARPVRRRGRPPKASSDASLEEIMAQ